MNKEEITRQQLAAIRDHLMVQYGSVLCLTLAFLFFVVTVILVACNWRRTALTLYAAIAVLTFMVPTPVTFYLSPLVLIVSISGIIWITMRTRSAGREPEVTASAVARPPAKSAAL